MANVYIVEISDSFWMLVLIVLRSSPNVYRGVNPLTRPSEKFCG